MTEGLSIIVIGLTIAAYVIKEGRGALHLIALLAWGLYGFYMVNQTFVGNDFLPQAFLFFSIGLMIIEAVMALNAYMNARAQKSAGLFSSEEAEEREYKKQVYKVTKKARPHW